MKQRDLIKKLERPGSNLKGMEETTMCISVEMMKNRYRAIEKSMKDWQRLY